MNLKIQFLLAPVTFKVLNSYMTTLSSRKPHRTPCNILAFCKGGEKMLNTGGEGSH